MPDLKISEWEPADDLTGDEILPLVQGGQNRRSTVGAATASAGGLPAGGTTGQVLAKASSTNYDTEWVAAGGGGSDRRTVTALTSSSGVVTIDYALGDYFTFELDEDVSGVIIANPPTGGASIGVEITQDSTARTVAFGAEYEFTASSPLDTVPSGAGGKALLIMTTFDGGNNWWLTMDTLA